MPVLDNARHERFAQAVASGQSASEAYVTAGYKKDRGAASRLSANVSIETRIQEIQGRAAEIVAYEKADCVRDLVAIIKAAPSTAGPNNRLCDRRMSKAGPYYSLPGVLDTMARLAKMLGWDASEKLTLDAGDSLTTYLAKIRQRK